MCNHAYRSSNILDWFSTCSLQTSQIFNSYVWARLKRETTDKYWDIVKKVMNSKLSDPVPRVFLLHHITNLH